MQKQVRCPKCKTQQPISDKCVSCGLDFKEYARKLREKRAAKGGAPRRVKCPVCKKVQTMGDKCVDCGLDFREYARKKKEGHAAAPGEGPEQQKPAEAPEEKPAEETSEKGKAPKSAIGKKPIDLTMPVFQKEPELSAVGDLFGNAWLIFKGRFPVLLGLYLLSVALLMVPMSATVGVGALTVATWPGSFVAIFLVSVLGSLVGMVAWLWGFGAFISASCDEMQDFKGALRSGWRNLWPLLWLYLLVAYIIQGGFLLFILPGIAWTVSFFAAQFIIFEERERGMAALLKSRAYVKGHWWGVFWRLLVIFVLLSIASVVPFGGILFTPFMMIYLVLLYKELRTIKGTDVKYSSTTGTKAGWLVLATAGYAVPAVLLLVFVGMATLKNISNLGDLQSLATQELSQMEMEEGRAPASQEAPTGPEAFYEPELELDKYAFLTGERITVHFKAPSTFAKNAWVGIIPSSVPHGSEAENDRHDISYQYLSGRTAGDLVFTAPSEAGIYDLRMHDTDDGGKEVASTTIAVESGTPTIPSGEQLGANAEVMTLKQEYLSGEPIEIEFSGLPGGKQDWITLVEASASDSTHGQWFYTGGLASGRHTFRGITPGDYEVRVYFNWPSGGYNVQARYGFTVRER